MLEGSHQVMTDAGARAILEALTRIERKVDALATRGEEKRLLSLRAAARRLGVGRGDLGVLVGQHRIRTVPWLNQTRIPMTEIERILREGMPEIQVSPRRGKRAEKKVSESILDIPID